MNDFLQFHFSKHQGLDIIMLITIFCYNYTVFKFHDISDDYSKKFNNSLRWIRTFLYASFQLFICHLTLNLLDSPSVNTEHNDILVLCFRIAWGVALLIILFQKINWFIIIQSVFIMIPLGLSIFNFMNYDIDLKSVYLIADNFFSENLGLGDSSKIHISSLIIAIFYFLNFFIPLEYAGKLWSNHMSINKTNIEGIDIEGLNKAFALIAIIISFIITLFLMDVKIETIGIITGAIGIAISFSVRDFLANFLAGLILYWDDSIKKGHVISLENYIKGGGEVPFGWVHKINLRYTIIKDRNDVNILIPNSALINNPIINWTHEELKVRIKLDINVSYDSDIDIAISLMKRASSKEERVLKDPAPTVNIIATEESSIHLQLRFFIIDSQKGIRNIKSAIYKTILTEFKKNKINIPFPQSDVHIKEISFRSDGALSKSTPN